MSHTSAFDRRRRTIGLFGAPICALLVFLTPMPDLSLAAHKLLALMTLVALWWITEPLPLPVTALLGPTLAVVIGIVPASTAFSAFANPLIFLFMGCCAAIALGRLGDFMNYFLYIDRKTNLPNRGRCDLQVEKYSAHLLPDWFACLYIQFRFDGVNQAGVTRKSGDNALKKLGKILGDALSSEGFVGYNNSGQFIGLFEHCNEDKVQTMVDRITAEIEYANSLEPAESITINVGHAISNMESIYDVRKLLQAAIKNSKQ